MKYLDNNKEFSLVYFMMFFLSLIIALDGDKAFAYILCPLFFSLFVIKFIPIINHKLSQIKNKDQNNLKYNKDKEKNEKNTNFRVL